MDKTQLKRHDLIYPSAGARNRLQRELVNGLTGEQALLTAAIFREDRVIPGIVRRAEALPEDSIPLGFVSPQLYDDRRLRVAAVLKSVEAVQRQRPYDLTRLASSGSTACMAAARAVCCYAAETGTKLGILGSAGLEMATGLHFTNAKSDLDLLITGVSLDRLREVYGALQEIGRSFQVAIDLEVELVNGYGIKAAELFQPTQTVLGKSLQDVQILKKKTVLEILSQEA